MQIAEVEPSGLIVLGCSGCGERIVLFGREEDWRREGRLTFPCAGCNGEVDLAERAAKKEEEEGPGGWVRKLTRTAH